MVTHSVCFGAQLEKKNFSEILSLFGAIISCRNNLYKRNMHSCLL